MEGREHDRADEAGLDLSRLRTFSIRTRKHKVKVADFSRPLPEGGSVASFLDALPKILGAETLRRVAAAIVAARRRGKPVIIGMGAHVIKCGLGPLIIEAMELGWLSGVSMNGAGPIHDFEVATIGETSEDVAQSLVDGSFGMVTETLEEMNAAINAGVARGLGYGEALGRHLLGRTPAAPHVDKSIVAQGARLGVPVMVHVAIGCDTIHMHPSASGAALGEGSLRDFRKLAYCLKDMGDGGVFLNVGSAVILPEVFLKALSLVRNLGHPVHGIVTANLDMVQHYRPGQNVVSRPTGASRDGAGYAITGHHEIMVPLLFAAVREGLRMDPVP